MKWNYKLQLIVTVLLVVVCGLLAGVLNVWFLRPIGRFLAGLLWVIFPVLPEGVEDTKGIRRIVRVCGALLILYGLFGR